MNILWITNILFPEANRLLTGSDELKASGGWLLGAARGIVDNCAVNLTVASVSPLVKSLTKLKGNRVTYYVLPYGKGNERVNLEYCKYWEIVKSETCPDLVHIHGTEFSHGHAYLKSCGAENVVVSIQGLTSACAYYYCYGISMLDILMNLTIHDLIKGTMIHGKRGFRKRGEFEVDTLKMAKHIIGRTSWDRARTWAINPEAMYHFCNETLRPEFYDGSSWTYEHCEKHTIFLSQVGYPIKGLHQVLRAMRLIIRHYPDTVLRIAGNDITRYSNLSEFVRYTGYGRYIKHMIRKSGLKDKVFFTGSLNGQQMKREYLKANVFVCPSSIENSPNSLGEAQLLGTPCVASYVGGIPDMMKGNEENLYRYEEFEMLAEIICKVFAKENEQVDMRSIASERHNSAINSEMLLSIYDQIIEEKS